MKKSELYEIAIMCVIDDRDYLAETKISVIEMLLEARNLAQFAEKFEEGKKA